MTTKCLMPQYGRPDISVRVLGLILGMTLICSGMGFGAQPALAQAQQLPPTYWKHRLFYIPYQVNQPGKLLDPIAKVQLLLSSTGANDWTPLEEAEPNVRGFSYHAPADGEYWFALRHLDRRGQPWPNATVQPQMRLVVDTMLPELSLDGSFDATGEIVIRYEARDINLAPDSLLIEVLGSGKQWSPLRPGTADIAQKDRLLGRVRWRAPLDAPSVKVRAAISDKAGQRGLAEKVLAAPHSKLPAISVQPSTGPTLRSPALSSSNFRGPNVNDPALGTDMTPKLSKRNRELPSRDWPASNRLPSALRPAQVNARQAPPSSNPYSTANQATSSHTPAKLVGDSPADASGSAATSSGAESLVMSPLGSVRAPPLTERSQWPRATPFATDSIATAASATHKRSAANPWTPVPATADGASRLVNSRTFDIEYDLQLVGPWGVSKVELWATHDNGRSWQTFGVDPDNRSPFRVTVPSAGTFGFRLLVDGANSAGATPPQPGDDPELIVSVDLEPPSVELLTADLGKGNLADHLLVRWTATDTNLEPRPIALFYSSYPNGPWSTIASGLENTGSYTWRIERHVPGRFYLRLEARDTAGNLSTFQKPSPIALARPQPTGRLRNVRPITGDARP